MNSSIDATKLSTRSRSSRVQVAPDEMNWDSYAEHYDLMCDFNPSYQENIQELVQRLKAWGLPDNCSICDLGAGTGNYICEMATVMPNARFVHVDLDRRMNQLASEKYASRGVTNVEIVSDFGQTVSFAEHSFDLVISVNALYAISPQESVLKSVHRWLKPNGRFFVIDFGRKQRVLDWTVYLFRESMKRRRVGTYVKALIEGREVIRQNRRSTKGQNSGRYWMHSTKSFGETLEQCGFEVEELSSCYRGYSDLAVCRPKPG